MEFKCFCLKSFKIASSFCLFKRFALVLSRGSWTVKKFHSGQQWRHWSGAHCVAGVLNFENDFPPNNSNPDLLIPLGWRSPTFTNNLWFRVTFITIPQEGHVSRCIHVAGLGGWDAWIWGRFGFHESWHGRELYIWYICAYTILVPI